MRIQQFNAHIIDSNSDLILVHSQWLKAFSVVHFPPLINMLKFGGCASMISCLRIPYARSCIPVLRGVPRVFYVVLQSPAHTHSSYCTQHVSAVPSGPRWQATLQHARDNMQMLFPLRQTNVRIHSDNTLCVEIPMDSRNRTIHNVYHISLHSSSNTEPTHKSIHDL